MSKQLLFGDEARQKVLRGAATIRRAVASTLGPRSNNVGYQRPFGTPGVVHDGVTVAKEVELEDPFENIAAELVKDAASQTNDAVGDGTTVTVVLTEAMLTEGNKLVAAGHNPMMLRRGMEKGVDYATEYLASITKPVKTDEEIEQVATISAQSDRLGKIIAKAFKKLGKDAVITVEESNSKDIYVEYKDGLEIDQGYMSPYFVTDQSIMETNIEDPLILVTDRTLSDTKELVDMFNMFQRENLNKPGIIIIAADITGAFLSSLVLTRLKNGLPILAVKAPSFGDNQRALLEDLAITTGATFVSQESGMKLDQLTPDDLGNARRVVATKDNTTFIDGKGEKKALKERISLLKTQLKKPMVSEYESERLQERLAKLTSGIAIINVGAASEGEAKELKERVIDAVSATKAAYEEGIVAGGETALLRAAWDLEQSEEADEGMRLVASALKQPFRTLMTNSGYDAGEMYTKLPAGAPGYGVDVIDGKVKNLIDAGIIDPAKVPRTALKNAASTATMLLSMDSLIVDTPKKEEEVHQVD